MTTRANADIARLYLTLAAVTSGVLAIAGTNPGTFTCLSSVSKYDIASDTWESDYPGLIQARENASACVLQKNVYVFCGYNYFKELNTIEVISETYLFPQST